MPPKLAPAETVGAALAARADNKAIKTEIVKFTHEGAAIFTADAEPAAHNRARLIFTLADSGIGISWSKLKQLFRPFAQASVDIARRYGGAGLGLSFVKRLAKAMGGDLKVNSKKGSGSTFRLIALVDRADAHPGADRMKKRTAPRRPLSILCAEDNPYGRVVMNTILHELGHNVDFTETAEAAVEAVARGTYEAVLMTLRCQALMARKRRGAFAPCREKPARRQCLVFLATVKAETSKRHVRPG